MDETAKMESQISSAAAFVEGGIQDACDDACSICLEAFCHSDPSTVTDCKHEFHLQCILEWCQRSAQCPMCWQLISLKDPSSQELLETVEHERSIRSNKTPNTAMFHHPALGDFELQHLPVGVNDAELEERIIEHLAAAAAAMGRTHHLARRGQRVRSSAQGRPQFLVFSTHPNTNSVGSVSASSAQLGENELTPAVVADDSSTTLTATGDNTAHQVPNVIPAQADPVAVLSSGIGVTNTNGSGLSNSRISAGQSTPDGQDIAGPSDFQEFSESLKSRLNAVSMRCKESITKSTRGWKERLFSRNSSVADLGSEVRREVTAGIATVTRMMERLDTRDGRKTAGGASTPHNVGSHSVTQPATVGSTDNNTGSLPNATNTSTAYAASTSPN